VQCLYSSIKMHYYVQAFLVLFYTVTCLSHKLIENNQYTTVYKDVPNTDLFFFSENKIFIGSSKPLLLRNLLTRQADPA
jgi:hypothetical protein